MPKEFEIRREVALPVSPAQVWDAIATGPGQAAWFMPMPVDPDSDMVKVWEPGERLLVETPEQDDGSMQAFEYVIEARGEGTAVLRFVHRGFLGDDWSDEFEPMTGAGWDMYLATLVQYLTHFADRPATYIEAEGPASSASADAWPALLAALGRGSEVALGDQVHVALDGATPIDGEVDYVTRSFVGIRTGDALIRFHGRWPLDMTVAVSHHAYGTVDAAATTKAWTAWLAGVFG
jgi:hypothetical protein